MGCHSPFATRIVCACCSGYFGSKVWGSNTKYRRVIWQCNDKYKDDVRCSTPHVTEEDIKARFLTVWNQIAGNKETLIADCKDAKALICDCKAINKEIMELEREAEVAAELSRKAIYENARTAQNQDEFNERNNGYLGRQCAAMERIETLEAEKRRRRHKGRILETFIRNLASSPEALTEFDEKLWTVSIDRVTVTTDGKLIFRFMDGTEVEG